MENAEPQEIAAVSQPGTADGVPAVFWPELDESCILQETDDRIFIDKPPFVPCQEAETGAADDVVTRLAHLLAARAGAGQAPVSPVYLGVHQRLDAATSGVLVYAKRKEANAALAQAFEGRTAKKVYLAIVTGWHGPARTLTHHLTKGEDGNIVALPRPSKVSQEAITVVTPVARNGKYSMLELELQTGRTHQARVQLAAAGAPIVGDDLYGGEPGARLYLHASSLSFGGSDGGRDWVVAPRPKAFDDLLAGAFKTPHAVYRDVEELHARLTAAAERRRRLQKDCESGALSTFRWVNEEGDALPGLAIDVYGRFAVAQLYDRDEGTFSEADVKAIALAIRKFGFAGVYLKHRPKQANTLVDTRREDVAPPHAILGEDAPEPYLVIENGVCFETRLGDGLSTGLFLDMRRNRKVVRELAAGLRVANLFAYHCAFSVAAAVGGAREVVSVDATLRALERGQSNFVAAGVDPKLHRFSAEDCFSWLERTAKKGEQFDLIICDPPSYSKTKKTRFVASSNYAELADKVLRILAPGGKVLFFCNHRGMHQTKFRRTILGAARALEIPIGQLKDLSVAIDFPHAAGGDPALKGVLFTSNALSGAKLPPAEKGAKVPSSGKPTAPSKPGNASKIPPRGVPTGGATPPRGPSKASLASTTRGRPGGRGR